MNPNILFVCLDSCRYDVFASASTPNMDKIGKTQKVYSPGCFTQASVMSYMIGYPPLGAGRYTLFTMPVEDRLRWAPEYYTVKGYATAWMSSNAIIVKLDESLDGHFSKWFNMFKCMEYDYPGGTPQIAEDISRFAVEYESKPLFVVALLTDTHTPYFDGTGTHKINKDDPDGNFAAQVRAVEYDDRWFPDLLQPLLDTPRPTLVIITSDHGDLFGPDCYGHDPRQKYTQFDDKLYEIPFIVGEQQPCRIR